MRVLRRLLSRARGLFGAGRDEERLLAEIEEHLVLHTAENVRKGLDPVEARRQAALQFGAVGAMRDTCREQRGLPFLEVLIQDARLAMRRLRKTPAFTLTTVLTLALGIGATTSIFTLVHAVLLKTLSVSNPGELYRLGRAARCCYEAGYSQDKEFSLVSYDLYKYFLDGTKKSFVELAAFQAGEPLVGVRRQGVAGAAQSYPSEFVSGNYFTMFGISAYAGRLLKASDDRISAPAAAVMSYRLWQQRYGADPSVPGSVFYINEKPFTVVGIAPPGFFGETLRSTPPDFFLPLNTEPIVEGDGSLDDADLGHADTHWLGLLGRIRAGVNPAAVEAAMRVELKQWLRAHWGEMNARDRAALPIQTLFLAPGGAGITSMREEYEHWLQILMTVTGFVLLIVCANVANLMLVRGMERRRQTSLSMALGARPMRLVKQALTESILLSLLGGAAGLAVAFAGTRLILHFAFPVVGGMASIPIDASPSLPVLLFAFGLSLVTGVGFGIVPAWLSTRVDPIEALRGVNRSTARTGALSQRMLVIFQAALSLILLSAAGLLTSALARMENQNLGIDPERRIVVTMEPRQVGYGSQQLKVLYRRIRDTLESIPGVEAVALCSYSPQNAINWGAGVWVDGHADAAAGEDNSAAWDRVTPGYFQVIGNPILEGRGIEERDNESVRNVAVINEAFARKFFPGEDPLGRTFGRAGRESARQYQIIGVAKDVRNLAYLDKATGPFYFLPEAQHDNVANSANSTDREIYSGSNRFIPDRWRRFLHDVVIVTRPGSRVTEARLLQAMTAVDPNLPVLSVRSLSEEVAAQFSRQRLIARLTSFFGILSLVLASLGLYGVTAYNAGRRVNEIGVRMALGATRRKVITLVLRGAFGLILVGLLCGLPLALASGRFLGSQLYGMSPYDPVVVLGAVGALAVAALVASLIPAVRASRISPMEALRTE
jgi:predicted permease